MAVAAQEVSTLAGMPVGRRTPRGKKRWYLVYAPGREQATCEKLLKLVSRDLLEDAFVMRKERVRKRGGTWHTYTVPMYRDYVVVVTKDAGALDKELSKLSFPARIAKGEGRFYAPMANEAQAWYESMMDSTHTIRNSTASIVHGELHVQDGPLVGQESRVVKVMRQRSVCLVAVGEGSGSFNECVPLSIPSRS